MFLYLKTLFYIFLFLFLPILCSHVALASDAAVTQEEQDKDQRYKYLKRFSDILYIIEKSYVRKISAEQLIQSAIKGMVKELDAHSYFLPAEQLKIFTKEAKGRFSGLGMEIGIKNRQPVIISVLEDSPARKAGMKAGQIILQINDKKTVGLNKPEISKLLNSRRGKKFDIVVQDPDSKNIHRMQLQAELISFRSVVYKDLKDQFLYIRINVFTDRTLREIQKIIDKYKKPAGLLLDLRGNPGGLFESAIKVADLFIQKGTIVNVKGRLKDYEKIFKAHSPGTLVDCPILVLIDNYSASAAEVLAGALKDNKRGMLLGRKSFGKGSVQSLIQMDHGNAVKLTVAHYYTPDGHSIHEKGIQPHIELKRPMSADKSKGVQFTSKEDTDFHQALSFLKMFRFFGSISNSSSEL